MALLKEKTLPTGVSGNYWKIVGINMSGTSAYINLALFLDKEARDGGKDPIEVQGFDFKNFNPKEAKDANILVYTYGRIKESQPEVHIITEATTEEVTNEDGTITINEIPAVTETVEINFFADAVDA